jgi:hypothetical protein
MPSKPYQIVLPHDIPEDVTSSTQKKLVSALALPKLTQRQHRSNSQRKFHQLDASKDAKVDSLSTSLPVMQSVSAPLPSSKANKNNNHNSQNSNTDVAKIAEKQARRKFNKHYEPRLIGCSRTYLADTPWSCNQQYAEVQPHVVKTSRPITFYSSYFV